MDPKKIMIVEDEVIVGMDLKKKVQNLGYAVEAQVIRYGEEVLHAAQKIKPDLILMDIHLKGDMDGTQAASQVHKKLGVPIVFLTAYSDPKILTRAKHAEPYAYLKKPVRIEDLKISLIFSLYRAEMDQKLRASELRFRTVSDYAYDWETWIGPDGGYVYSSRSCERLTGYTADRFLEDPSFFYTVVHKEDRQRIKTEFQNHLAPGTEDCFCEFRIIRSDGATRWVEHFCRPVFDTTGLYIGRRASNRDISKRKALKLELEKKVTELQDALDNIKTLKGLIPICSNCKQIRDDQGYWTKLEAYIQSHSEARFSHGMCPACMDECYGDDDWYMEWKSKQG